MSIFPTTQGVPQTSDICSQEATNLVGSAAREDFKSVFTKAETKLGYAFQDSEILVAGGGDVTFDGTNLTWSGDIKFYFKRVSTSATETMTINTVSASNIALANDYALTFEVARASNNTITFSAVAVTAMDSLKSSNINKKIFAIRTGDVVYLRTGQSLQIGQTVKLGASGSGSGQGELNYITNPSAESTITGWTSSAPSSLLVSRIGATTETPREFLTGTAIKIVGSDNNETGAFVVSPSFALDDVDYDRVLKIQWDQKSLGAYADGHLVLEVTKNDGGTLVATPVISNIPDQDGTFATTFITSDSSTLQLRIKATTNLTLGEGIAISNVIVGPGQLIQGAPISNWTSFTPSFGNLGWTVTSAGKYRRVGDSVEIQVYFQPTSGAGSGSNLNLTIPGGFSIDTSKLTDTSTAAAIGKYYWYNNGGGSAEDSGVATYLSTTSVRFLTYGTGSFTTSGMTTSDYFSATIVVPIVGMSSNIYLGSGADTSVSPLNATAYTPTIGALGTGSTSENYAKYQRINDQLYVYGYFVKDASAGTGGGNVSISLPSGLTLDPNKLNSSGAVYKTAIGDYRYTGGSTSVGRLFTFYGTGNSSVYMDLVGSGIAASSLTSYSFMVPILGWTAQDYIGKMLVGFSSATPSNVGLTSSFTPLIKNRNKEINNSNYTILDTDGFDFIYSSTTLDAADKTITLPTAADNTGRIITISKLDSGNYSIIIKGEAAGETINGISGTTGLYLFPQYTSVTLMCTGAVWFVKDAKLTTDFISVPITVASGRPTYTFSSENVIQYGSDNPANVTAATCLFRRNGDCMDMDLYIDFSGAVTTTGGTMSFSVPYNLAIDSNKYTGSNGGFNWCQIYTNSKQYFGWVRYNGTGSFIVTRIDDSGATDNNWSGSSTGVSNRPGGADMTADNYLHLKIVNAPISTFDTQG